LPPPRRYLPTFTRQEAGPMQSGAHIGSSLVIKGEMSAREPVSISGRVEGTIDVSGHTVTIEVGGLAQADVAAAGIVVAGSVKGSLVAENRIELRSTADVEGDVTAPRVSVAEGAYLRGKVHITGEVGNALKIARAS
jgi:cytoskeletal protein CcmA (bactofilin family)